MLDEPKRLGTEIAPTGWLSTLPGGREYNRGPSRTTDKLCRAARGALSQLCSNLNRHKSRKATLPNPLIAGYMVYCEKLSKLQERSFGVPRVANRHLFDGYCFEDTLREMMKLEYIYEGDGDHIGNTGPGRVGLDYWIASSNGAEGLPLSRTTILSKYAYFIAVTHPYTAKTIAQFFLDHIYRLYGLLKSIVSDRDKFKKCLSPNTTMGSFPECDAQGLIDVEPAKLLLDEEDGKQTKTNGVF
ncbi:hypothetical protein Tco_0256465 [Tanacetum coccineum]